MVAWRSNRSHWALTALLSCLGLLILAPTAFAVGNTGEIKGTVTEAEDFVPLKNIEVIAYEANGKESFVGSATTEANGVYTVEGLPEGEYKVEFFAGFENFVPQFYKNTSSPVAAVPVKVVTGQTTEKIDAELQVGGKVEGTVTNASTHAALPNVEVVALGAGEIVDGFALTNSSGQYTIAGLATGSYEIGFAGSGYITQYYDDQPLFASAKSVSVIQKSTTSPINAALIPKVRAPINTVAPIVSGTGPALPPPPLTPGVKLLSTKVVVSGSSARVPLACANATCRGTIELTERIVIKHRRGRHTTSSKKTLILGRGSYVLTAGRSATIVVRLTAMGGSALSKAGHHRLSAKLLASVAGGLTVGESVLLSEVTPAKPKSTH